MPVALVIGGTALLLGGAVLASYRRGALSDTCAYAGLACWAGAFFSWMFG